MKALATAQPSCPCSTARLVEALVEAVAGSDVHTAVAVVVDPMSDVVEALFAFRMLAIWLSPSTTPYPLRSSIESADQAAARLPLRREKPEKKDDI